MSLYKGGVEFVRVDLFEGNCHRHFAPGLDQHPYPSGLAFVVYLELGLTDLITAYPSVARIGTEICAAMLAIGWR